MPNRIAGICVEDLTLALQGYCGKLRSVARKLADEVRGICRKSPPCGPTALGTWLARREAEPIFEESSSKSEPQEHDVPLSSNNDWKERDARRQ